MWSYALGSGAGVDLRVVGAGVAVDDLDSFGPDVVFLSFGDFASFCVT